jgi:hypothetical protein
LVTPLVALVEANYRRGIRRLSQVRLLRQHIWQQFVNKNVSHHILTSLQLGYVPRSNFDDLRKHGIGPQAAGEPKNVDSDAPFVCDSFH